MELGRQTPFHRYSLMVIKFGLPKAASLKSVARNLKFLTHESFVVSSRFRMSLQYSIVEPYSRNEDTKY